MEWPSCIEISQVWESSSTCLDDVGGVLTVCTWSNRRSRMMLKVWKAREKLVSLKQMNKLTEK